MRRFAFVFAALMFAACATDNTAGLPDPDFALTQLSKVPEAAEHITGGFPVQYRLHILNRAPIPITLRSVNVSSVGMGAYDLPSTTRPFNIPLEPDKPAAVDFFVSAIVADPTIIGANGPVTLHGIVTFDSAVGQFQRTFMLQANEA